MKYKLKRFGLITLFVLIPLLPIIIFWLLPIIVSTWISFTDWNYISPNFNYVGVDNYSELLTNAELGQAIKNTLQFAIFTFIPNMIIGFALSLVLSQKMRGKAIFKGLMFSPYLTPTVAISIVWSWIYDPTNGLFNSILNVFGIQGPSWLTDSNTAMWAIILMNIWQNLGYTCLFYSDALNRIPDSLFEVSDIAGASFWQKLKKIYIPLVSPTTLFLAVMSILGAVQAYDQIAVMTGGGPAGATRTIMFYYQQLAFEYFNIGQAAAMAIMMLVVTALLSGLAMWISRKHVYY